MKLEHLRILDGKSLLWDDIVNYYTREVMQEDYIIYHEWSEKEIKKLTATRPFFSGHYVCEVHISHVTSQTLNSIIRMQRCEWIVFIFICSNRDDFDDLTSVCTKSFDGYKIPLKFWQNYVVNKVGCKCSANLSDIYKILGGRFELTDMIIDYLNEHNGYCTIKQVNTLIGKKEIMSIDIMWFSILRRDYKNKGRVFKFLDEYRYGYSFIYNTIKSKYQETIVLYKDFHEGRFNNKRLREYKKESKVSTWKLTSYLDIFMRVSYDELLLIGEIIECSRITSPMAMFVLVGKIYDRDFSEVMELGWI